MSHLRYCYSGAKNMGSHQSHGLDGVDRGGHSCFGFDRCTILFRATPRRDPAGRLFVRKSVGEPTTGTSRATPPRPQDATDHRHVQPLFSSRHIGTLALPRSALRGEMISVIGRHSRTPPSPPWRWAGHHPWLAGAIVGLASSLFMLLPALLPSATNRRSVVLFALLLGFTLFLVVGIYNTVRFGSQRSTDREQD